VGRHRQSPSYSSRTTRTNLSQDALRRLPCLQTTRYVWLAGLQAVLLACRNRDLLGFADITTDLTPPNPLIHFLSSTIPANVDEFAERFESNRALLTEFAINNRLDSNIPTPERNRLYREFLGRLPFVD
jgi:hypothetical protein